MKTRQYSFLDQLLIQTNEFLETIFSDPKSSRENPGKGIPEVELSENEKQKSVALMRVNHCGEVCAQALYQGQFFMAQNPVIKNIFKKSAIEETDHLHWTSERIQELKGHTSYLNGIWYMGSFLIGMTAGFCGDKWSLGFVEETEKQVYKHLTDHLGKFSENDFKSRAIVEQMRFDEKEHGQNAKLAGAQELPQIIKTIMKYQAKIMTTVSYWI